MKLIQIRAKTAKREETYLKGTSTSGELFAAEAGGFRTTRGLWKGLLSVSP